MTKDHDIYDITVTAPVRTVFEMPMTIYARTMEDAKAIALSEARRLTDNNEGWWSEDESHRTLTGKFKAQRSKV
tara:strand:+ start:3339 stop:3560 length:222 start_codon:yes stop_codon:yes gene_type:complete